MSHHEGFTDLAHEHCIFGLPLQGSFIINDSLFWLLDVHKGGCDELEVLDATLGIENLKVTPRVVVPILELIQVNLSLLLLRLDEGAVTGLDFLKHVQGSLRVAHLQGQVGLC